MNVTIRLFARARDLVGAEMLTLKLPEGASVGALKRELVREYPSLQTLAPHLLVAIGTDYASEDATIPNGAEIAVFPPVSGG